MRNSVFSCVPSHGDACGVNVEAGLFLLGCDGNRLFPVNASELVHLHSDVVHGTFELH